MSTPKPYVEMLKDIQKQPADLRQRAGPASLDDHGERLEAWLREQEEVRLRAIADRPATAVDGRT